MKKLKVLVSAYACEPDKGSEPGVGWNWVKQISKFAQVWVITRTNNREVIERELRKNPDPNLYIIYTDVPRWLRFWKRGERGVRLYYYLWQFAGLKSALVAIRKVSYDLSHHITFVNNWQPSFLSLLPPPFVWGPIGSNSPIPRSFLGSIKDKVLETVRLSLQKLFRCLDPFFLITLLRAKKIITINSYIIDKYPFSLISRDKFAIEQAIGITIHGKESFDNRSRSHIIRVISVGQLIYLKGFHLATEAFLKARKEYPMMEFVVIGDGREKSKLINLSKKHGSESKITFLGKIARDKVLEELTKSDIFLFPSFEGGGMVVLEAMSCGLPIVCLDFGGPGEMVDSECGIKIKPLTTNQVVDELSEALLRLVRDPDTRRKMGEKGRKKVSEVWSWDSKKEFIKKIYEEVIVGD